MRRGIPQIASLLLLALLIGIGAGAGVVAPHAHDQVFAGRGGDALRSHDCGAQERHESLDAFGRCALCQRGGSTALASCAELPAVVAPPARFDGGVFASPLVDRAVSHPRLRGPPSVRLS